MFLFGPLPRAGMRKGTVPRQWAEEEHELWAEEIAEQQARASRDRP
jgi:cytochrome b subunit of formate dehydrogenase